MRLSSKQSYRFCRPCGALPNNLISLLPTCLIAMDFDDNDDAEFDAAAGAILAITSATATAIATSILPILMELNDSLSSEEDGEDNEQPRLRRAVTPLYKAPVEYEAISFLLKFEHLRKASVRTADDTFQ